MHRGGRLRSSQPTGRSAATQQRRPRSTRFTLVNNRSGNSHLGTKSRALVCYKEAEDPAWQPSTDVETWQLALQSGRSFRFLVADKRPRIFVRDGYIPLRIFTTCNRVLLGRRFVALQRCGPVWYETSASSARCMRMRDRTGCAECLGKKVCVQHQGIAAQSPKAALALVSWPKCLQSEPCCINGRLGEMMGPSRGTDVLFRREAQWSQ